MANPILQMINNSNPNPTLSRGNDILSKLSGIKQLIRGQNPQVLYDNMIRTNPQFAQFVEQNKGKSVEDIARSYGVDLNTLKTFFE